MLLERLLEETEEMAFQLVSQDPLFTMLVVAVDVVKALHHFQLVDQVEVEMEVLIQVLLQLQEQMVLEAVVEVELEAVWLVVKVETVL